MADIRMFARNNGNRMTFAFNLTLLGLFACNAESKIDEVCQLETMKGRCRWNSEVIVMTSARWGRMKTGRCLEVHPNLMATLVKDPLFLGCSEDVLPLLDWKCSGRPECDIRIPDADLDNIKPCYPELKYYLEISYLCVPVVPEARSCTVAVTNQVKFLSSFTNSFTDLNSISSCGSASHPWRIEAPLGQRINISLLDFNSPSDREVKCGLYGYIKENAHLTNVSSCSVSGALRPQRERSVYGSETHRVEIVLNFVTSGHNFLLKLEAVGCTNMIPPDNAWLKRHNNDMAIGCYLSQQTWQLKCDGHEWKGQVGTCPESYHEMLSPVTASNKSDDTLMENVAMVVIAVAAACICLLVACIGCYSSNRYKRKSNEMSPSMKSMKPKLLLGENYNNATSQSATLS